MSTPAYGDFDPSVPGLEVIVCIETATVSPITLWTDIYAMHADGSLMSGWGPRRIDAGGNMRGPALGDVDADGALELALAVNEHGPTKRAWVLVLESDGSPVAGRWPAEIEDIVACSVVLADLTGDGFMEVVLSGRSGKLYIWEHDGTPFRPGVWPVNLGGTLYFSPAVGTVGRGSPPSVVVGCCSSDRVGRLYVLGVDGKPADGWPQAVERRWMFTPTVADIDQDGDSEIVVGAGEGQQTPGLVYAFEADGSLVSGVWPVEIWETEYPEQLRGGHADFVTVADLDPAYPGLEVVTAPSFKSRIYAFHADGTTVRGWPTGGRAELYLGNPPAIGDLDGRPGLEVVSGEGNPDERGRFLFVLHADGSNLGGTPIDLGDFTEAAPAVGDLDDDGRIEIIQPVSGAGLILAFQAESPGVQPASLVWPMQQHDACRSSYLRLFPSPHAVGDPPIPPGGAGPAGLVLDPCIWTDGANGNMALHLIVRRPGSLYLELFDLRGRLMVTPVDGREVWPGEVSLRMGRLEQCASGIYFARATICTSEGAAVRSVKFAVVR